MAILAVIGFVLALIVYPIWSGYVLSVLWGWFFVPTLALPQLSIPAAIGIAMTVSYMTYQHNPPPEEGDAAVRFGKLFPIMLFKPAMALCVGWIVKQWL